MCLHATAKSADANLVCWPQANTKFQLCICLFQWMRSKALYLQIVSLSLCKVGKSATFSLHEVYFAIKDGKLRKERTLFFFSNMHVHVSQTIQSCNGLLMHQHGCHLCSFHLISMIQDLNEFHQFLNATATFSFYVHFSVKNKERLLSATRWV